MRDLSIKVVIMLATTRTQKFELLQQSSETLAFTYRSDEPRPGCKQKLFRQKHSWLRKHICKWDDLESKLHLGDYPISLVSSLSAQVVNSPREFRSSFELCAWGAVGLSRSQKFTIETIYLVREVRHPLEDSEYESLRWKFCTVTYY